MTTTWRDKIRTAGSLAPNVQDDLQRLIEVVDGVIAGKVDQSLLQQVLGDKEPPELQTQLDKLARERAETEPLESMHALWAVLRGLPELLAELSRIQRGGTPRLRGHFSISDALNQMEEVPPLTGSSEFRCPRCRSNQVQCRRESVGDGDHLVELKCRRCGLYDSILSDDPAVADWSR